MVPIIYAVGNHDLGLNNDPGVKYPSGRLTPLFVQYFTQGFSDPKVPPLETRQLTHAVSLTDLIIYSLDVGYDQAVQGQQHFWLEDHMLKNPNQLKFAHYHDPTYTSCIREDVDVFHNLQTVLQWNPIFDRYHLLAAFENHAHLFKFSRKLKGNLPHDNGTLYLGDGAWGADINDCILNKNYELYQALDRKHHVYLVDVYYKSNVTYTAIDINN